MMYLRLTRFDNNTLSYEPVGEVSVKTFVICLIVMLTGASAFARIINVPADYATIQAGIDASANGDTVLVAPGEYIEVFYMHGKNILLTSSHGPDTTLVRGHCWIDSGEDSTCIIKGFSFIGVDPVPLYALISCLSNLSPKIEGNILTGNQCSIGGGIYAPGSNPIIRSNIIKNNYASGIGGGICVGDEGQPTLHAEISGNIITNNRTGFSVHGEGRGGGIIIKGDAIVRHNIIYDNKAIEGMFGGDGGGIYRYETPGTTINKMVIENNTVVKNIAKTGNTDGRGGGLYFASYSANDSLIIRNNIFAFNPWGGNVRGYLHDSMYFQWDYNLIFDDTILNFRYGDHDIFVDPLFSDTTNNNFHLLGNSPCINSGDPSSPLDPDSTRADIGAYYFDQSVGIDDDGAPSGPYLFTLKQNYPNPFNSQTIISYSLDKESTVSLQIYAITGHLVLPLINKEIQKAGEHKYIWEGRDNKGQTVSTGVYFYELYVNGTRESKAMILIK
jgi:hypothetical protein